MKSLTRKPGEFRAICRAPRWVPIEELLEVDPDTTQSRWDRTLQANVFLAQCSLETTNRKVFAEHMAAAHGVKSSASLMTANRGFPAWPTPSALRKPWRPPALTEDGAPFRDRGERTETCPKCGLVSEVSINNAVELWWREHLELCTGEIPEEASERGAA